jgi:3-hydroxyisobutyrate dehydrogenase-like beta-hydroxyacid dehydrogenase
MAGQIAEIRALETVGLIGCGRMGQPIAGHLLDAGRRLIIVDPSDDAKAPLLARGAVDAATPAELARDADVILVIVVDDEQTRAVVSGPDGILSTARPGSVIVICPSIHPRTCQELAEQAAESGVHLVDAPMVGGHRGAKDGNLTLMCGGEQRTMAALGPVLAAFATNICHLGPVGAGQVGKTTNNMMLWACLRIDVEALRLARAYGVEPGTMRPAMIVGSGGNVPLEKWGSHRLTWPAKDLEVAVAMAEEAGLDLKLTAALGPLMAELTVEDLSALT